MQNIEKDNIVLQENVTRLKNELKTATEELVQNTTEIKNLKILLHDYEGKKSYNKKILIIRINLINY